MSGGLKTPEEQRLQDLLNLQAAFRSSGEAVPSKLHAEISTLAGATINDPLTSTDERDKQKQRAEAQITALVSYGITQEIAQSHVSLLENGFQSDNDFFKFGKMLDDEKYWDYLQDHPEERNKVANCLCDGLVHSAVKDGAKTPEQITEKVEAKKEQMIERSSNPDRMRNQLEQLSQEGDLHGKIRAASTAKSTNRSSETVKEIVNPVTSLVGEDKMADLAAKADKVEKTIESSQVVTVARATEEKQEKREAAKEIRNEVLTKAEDMEIKTKRQEFNTEKSDNFAALLAEPETKIAANTLKQTQEEVKNEPISKPADVAIAENSRAAEKSQDTGTSLA